LSVEEIEALLKQVDEERLAAEAEAATGKK
jgi:hypothetical protein